MFKRTVALLGLMLAIGIGLSGCAAEELHETPTLNPANVADEEAANSETGDPQQSENGDEKLETATEQSKSSNSECLIGEWVVTQSELQKFYDTVNVSQATFTITGDMGLTLKEAKYQFSPDFSLKLEIAGLDAVGEIVGDVRGSYSADEEILTTANENTDDVSFIITVMGQQSDGKEMSDTFLAMFAINEAPYECESTELTIGYQNVNGEAVVPVKFVRK